MIDTARLTMNAHAALSFDHFGTGRYTGLDRARASRGIDKDNVRTWMMKAPAGEQCLGAERAAPIDVLISRWRSEDASTLVSSVASDDCAILMIAVSASEATIAVDNALVHDGRISTGTFQLISPGQSVRSTFRKPAEYVCLHIPLMIFNELTAGLAFSQLSLLHRARPLHDHVIEQLALSIVNASTNEPLIDRHFLVGVGTALFARAGAVLASKRGSRSRSEGLIPWRLERVMDYIERHLDEPLSLADMACAAGLSRMHFAAQFRMATGVPPHAYLTRRRIERAQQLLRQTAMPLVEIAFSVGFQTQAHFTTIFRQFAGEPPGRWRSRELAHPQTDSRGSHAATDHPLRISIDGSRSCEGH